LAETRGLIQDLYQNQKLRFALEKTTVFQLDLDDSVILNPAQVQKWSFA